MGEEQKRLVLRLLAALAAGDTATICALLAPHYDHHGPLPSIRGRVQPAQELSRYFAHIHDIFPDFAIAVEDVLAEGDKVAVRWIARGTHRGKFLGVAPTGRLLTWRGVTVFRVRDDRIEEGWWTVDALEARHTLGLIRPAPRSADEETAAPVDAPHRTPHGRPRKES